MSDTWRPRLVDETQITLVSKNYVRLCLLFLKTHIHESHTTDRDIREGYKVRETERICRISET